MLGDYVATLYTLSDNTWHIMVDGNLLCGGHLPSKSLENAKTESLLKIQEYVIAEFNKLEDVLETIRTLLEDKDL